MRFVRVVAGLVMGVAITASAVAGSTDTKVPGVGSASMQWGGVRYRKQLLDQLSPGLVWRMGSNAATKLTVEGMALVCDGGVLFPGEANLNLRYLSMEKWELVAFEGDAKAYQWSDTRRTFAILPCDVWKEKEAKKASETLEFVLRGVTTKTRAKRPVDAATTGGSPPAKPEMTPAVTYSKEAQAELEKAPFLELEMRFGDLVGVTQFEAAEVGELKGKHGEAKTPFVLRWPKYKTPRAKSELVATGTDVVFGVLREEGPAPKEWLLVVSGGEKPELELRTVGKAETPRTIAGTSVEVKAAPKTIDWAFDGKALVLNIHGAAYTFPW